MHRSLIALSLFAVVLIASRIVTSDDARILMDQPPTVEPNPTATPLDANQIEAISDVRASNGLDFLQGEENDRLFEEALQHAANKDERLLEMPVSSENETGSALPDSLFESATLLNQRANELERLEDHLSADKCRNLAQTLRLEARTIQQSKHR